VDLPTYTSIWRIEKRLYKLYDFRLPMPVPVGQIAVFAAITVPYVILLTILGLPFNHTLFWLYVLPPGVITWLATRPVLESKRLPELISSQVRYLGEPGTWCRMAPLAEKDDVVVVGKVWRRDEELQRSPAEAPALAPAEAPAPARPARVRPAAARKAAAAATAGAQAAAGAQATAAGQPTRVPRAAPAPRLRQSAGMRGGAPQWADGARGPAGLTPAVPREVAPGVAAETAPAEVAHNERQVPARPAAGPASHAAPAAGPGATARPSPVGRHAAKPAPRASVPGLDPGDEESVTRHVRPEGADRPSGAAWPVKDPHAPANAQTPANRAPARPQWTSSGPSAQVPAVFGDVGGPARSSGPAVPTVPPAVPTTPATADPAPAVGDPAPPADPVPGVAASLAGPDMAASTGPDTAAPAPPTGPVSGWPASWDRQEPAAGASAGPVAGAAPGPGSDVARGMAAAAPPPAAPLAPPVPAPRVPGPAGFFIGLAPPEVTEDEPARDEPSTDRPTYDDLAQDEPSFDEPTRDDPLAGGAAGREVAEAERAEDEAPEGELLAGEPAEHEVAGAALAEPELAEPEVAEPEMAQDEPVVQDAAGDDPREHQRAEDEPPESELAEGELAADQVAMDERAEPELPEPEVAGPEMAQDEPVVQDGAGDEPPGDQRAEDELPKSELAEDEPAADQVAEDERAEPRAADPELADPEAAEPVAQAPAQEAPTGSAPEEDLPGEGVAGEEGAHEYRPEEDLPAEDAPPGAGPPAAPVSPWAPSVVVVRGGSSTRPTMVERALSGPGQHRAGSNWREHVRVVPGGNGPGRPDMERRDRARVLLPIHGPRLIVVLGCTVGAGQSVTTLMLADVLAALRGEPVAALDLNPGQASLTGLARTSPAATARGLLGGSAPIVPGQRGRGRLDLIAHDSAPDGGPALADGEYARVLDVLTSRYPLTLTDPGASAVARVLSTANQLVLVAPASADAARAVAMTMEWLDGHGYGELCTEAITVINGVSKRSMTHVEQAELVVRGRCRAIVRVPWDDHLGAPPSEQGISDAAADDESRFAQLRPQVQLAYTALAGVLVSALALEGNRAAPPGAAGPPDGAPERWVAR
jgi:MinD-like ATPase involved in chromosome partitioning or flagellar assembly